LLAGLRPDLRRGDFTRADRHDQQMLDGATLPCKS
jgi:hypothetical protein